MRSTLLPPEGTKTLYEDHYTLVHVDNAKDVSGSPKILPSLLLADELPPELQPQRASVYPPDTFGDGAEEGGGKSSSYASQVFDGVLTQLHAAVTPLGMLGMPLTWVWSRFLSGCHPRPSSPPLEWHPRQPWIAAADFRGRVQLIDIGPSCGSSSAMKPSTDSGGPGGVWRPELLAAGEVVGSLKAVLTHEALQQQALSLSWSPTSPGLLAVGSSGVVGLWAVAGEVRPPLAAAGRSPGPWLRLLRTRVAGARVTSVSWSPDGRMLAAASPNQAGLQVWDISTGTYTPVGAGLAAFDTVRWSPCSNYVFAAGTGSRHFYIFETHKWHWARWQIAASDISSSSSSSATTASTAADGMAAAAAPSYSFGGATSVVAAAWAPPAPGRNPILLAALSGMAYLVAVHVVDSPPGLTAQLLPVVLPELHRGGAAVAVSVGGRDAGASFSLSSGTSSPAAVADLAWDPRGERLAVLLALSPGQVPTCIALYSTITDPLVSARLIGLARPSQCLCDAAGAAGPGSGPVTAGFSIGQQQQQQADGVAAAAGGFEAGPSQPRARSCAVARGESPSASSTCQSASLPARPGSLSAARLAPLGCSSSGRGGNSLERALCVISARVGERGIYNLPCYL